MDIQHEISQERISVKRETINHLYNRLCALQVTATSIAAKASAVEDEILSIKSRIADILEE